MRSARRDPFDSEPSIKPDEAEVPSRYRALLLPEARLTERGLVYRRGEQRYLLAWSRVERAFAAEIGEPEGVRTIVFDLAVGVRGPECVVCRFDIDPGEEAMAAARAIENGVGRDRCSASLRSLAAEGMPTRLYHDIESFEEAALESIRFG
jgi:hypothetical protein